VNPDELIQRIKQQRFYHGQIVHVQRLPARKACYARLQQPLAPAVEAALRDAGITQLYVHQVRAIDAVRSGQHVIIATTTASGKTLCYNVPVLDAIATEPVTKALYLFPTKALAQDQLRGLNELTGGRMPKIRSATYDGDTPTSQRSRIRKQASIILTNPDMLHLGILPNHPLWAHFFRHLRYVVLDEAHHYRGVFGSQVACVLRRLRRVCAHYGVHPTFIAASATIANPAEHFQTLTGLEPLVVDDDGAPQAARRFVLWNPPFVDEARTARRSPNGEATNLFATLVRARVRTIVFTRARVVAELILRYARELLSRTQPELVDRIAAYRAGYLPEERRALEKALFHGELMGVTATTALELGIDVGDLDAVISVGYPGTVASLWQQAGRAGRTADSGALAILIGQDNPLDQYFMRHPQDLFRRPHETALSDPDNVYILQRHLPCAAFELPLRTNADPTHFDDEALFGPGFVDAMIELERGGTLRYADGRWVYTRHDYPAQRVSLRSIDGERFVILDESRDFAVLEEIEASSAPQRVHEGAVYLHQGESYLVTSYDAARGVATVRPVEVNYYTQPREWNDVRIIRSLEHQLLGDTTAYFGQVRVSSQVIGYRRLQQYTEAVLGEEFLDLPPQQFETMALWWDLPGNLPRACARRGMDFLGGIHAVEHATIGILPLFAMCDRWDIGGVSTPRHPDTDQAQIFIYDAHPGGVGIAEAGFHRLEALWRATYDVIAGCPCVDGCPSCIQSPKCGNNNEPLDKRAAIFILQRLLRE